MVVAISFSHPLGTAWQRSPLPFYITSDEDPTPILQELAPGPIRGFWRCYEDRSFMSLHVEVEDSEEGTLWALKWL